MSTFHGYFDRCFGKKIRADRFTAPQDSATVIQLLSHVHADHTVGLSSQDFRGDVYCSRATKDILLRSATASERVDAEISGTKSEQYYTFRNLNGPQYDARGKVLVRNGKRLRRDVLKALDLDVRHDFSSIFGEPLSMTFIDANHCPGAVMFLIESGSQTVLYTGDIRAEPHLINSLRENPILKPYVAQQQAKRKPGPKSSLKYESAKVIDEIYLDTAAAMTRSRILPKRAGVEEVLELFDLFPPDTRFFLNCWTWGYEELLRAVAHRYKCRIHLDAYKSRIYAKPSVAQHDTAHSSIPLSYPSLDQIGIVDQGATRFHACERRWKCASVRGDGQGCFDVSIDAQIAWKRDNADTLLKQAVLEKQGRAPHLVFVNMAEATPSGWQQYRRKVEAQCEVARQGDGDWPSNLLVPLARHSTLPELQDFVGLFRPRTIYPNTIYPEANGADYLSLSMPSFFGQLLAPGGKERLAGEAEDYVRGLGLSTVSSKDPPSAINTPRYLPRLDSVVTDSQTSSVQSQSQAEDAAVREEVIGKFASLSGRVGAGFLRDNFDHLDDVADIDLLMREGPSPARPVEEHRAKTTGDDSLDYSQELAPPPVRQDLRPQSNREASLVRQPTSETSSGIVCGLPLPVRTDSAPLKPSLPPPPSPAATEISVTRSIEPSSTVAVSGPVPKSAMESSAAAPAGKTSHFLTNLAIYFSEACLTKLEHFQPLIEAAGGIILTSATRQPACLTTAITLAHIVVCETRSGWEYDRALRFKGKIIGNLKWLAAAFEHQLLADPTQNLLWYPYLASPVAGFERTVVSSTGFSDSLKEEVQTLSRLLGARYLPEMVRAETTVLICCDSTCKKAQYAKKWKLPVVNFLWLEDCYLKQRLLPTTDALYRPDIAPRRRVCERPFVCPDRAEGAAEAVLDHPAERRTEQRTDQSAVRKDTRSYGKRALSVSLSPQRQQQKQQPRSRSTAAIEGPATLHPPGSKRAKRVPGAGLPPSKTVPPDRPLERDPVESWESMERRRREARREEGSENASTSTGQQNDSQLIKNVQVAYTRDAGIPRWSSFGQM